MDQYKGLEHKRYRQENNVDASTTSSDWPLKVSEHDENIHGECHHIACAISKLEVD